MVSRGDLGECFVDVFEISDPHVGLDSSATLRIFSELARLLPEEQYLRVKHAQTGMVAFADYELGGGLWYDPQANEEFKFNPPSPSTYPRGTRLLADFRPWLHDLPSTVPEPSPRVTSSGANQEVFCVLVCKNTEHR